MAQRWSPAQLQCTGTVQLVARSAGPSGEGRGATGVSSRREHDRLVMVVMTQTGGNNRWMVGAHRAANNKRLRDACALYAAPGRELLATSHCWCSTQFLRNSGSQPAGKFQNIFHGSRLSFDHHQVHCLSGSLVMPSSTSWLTFSQAGPESVLKFSPSALRQSGTQPVHPARWPHTSM